MLFTASQLYLNQTMGPKQLKLGMSLMQASGAILTASTLAPGQWGKVRRDLGGNKR